MPPEHSRSCDTDKIGGITQSESRNRSEGVCNQLRDAIAARLPGDMPEADHEAVLARATMFMTTVQSSLVKIAIEIALGKPADRWRTPLAHLELSGSTRPPVRPEERIAYRISEVVALTGVSRATVCKHIGTSIKLRKVGGVVLLDPGDVHRTFGFAHEEPVAPSPEALADIEELLQ